MEINLLELSSAALKLYLVLKCYEDKEGKCFPGQTLLKQLTGLIGTERLQKAREELIAKGLIIFTKKYTTTTSSTGKKFQKPQGFYTLVKCKTHLTRKASINNLNTQSNKLYVEFNNVVKYETDFTRKDNTDNPNIQNDSGKVRSGTYQDVPVTAYALLAKKNLSQEVNALENKTNQALSEFLGDNFKYEQGIAYRRNKSGWGIINNPAAYLASIESDNKKKSSDNFKGSQSKIDPASSDIREYVDEKDIWHFPIMTNGIKTGEKLIPAADYVAFDNWRIQNVGKITLTPEQSIAYDNWKEKKI